MAQDTPITSHRVERILAFMVAAAIGLSIVCFLAVIIGSGAKVDMSTPPWPTIFILPVIGLPLGAVVLVALIVVSGIRRTREAQGREAKDARK